jgi:putative transposase
MVRYRRNFVAGGTFFFTATLWDRSASTLIDNIGALRMSFRVARRERPFVIDAIVILPDHLHAIWTLPPDDADFSGRWRRIKSHFMHQAVAGGAKIDRRSNGEFAIWQRRFWEHTIRDESDFARHVDYIHFNPVKHGLVSRVRDWSYSSFHLFVRRGILPVDWGGDVKGVTGGFGERLG